ncbi:polysaccharide biosynthesis/export family protein [Lichenihabitans psoromatis]|uniref:polysaccharide biosynthesis/export family protein n=1 Tax=Lichenihabitans psoromatis TaxID=2528642 RepID=UPI0013F16ACE|nr:polysaccharide biosynthesis/export family protein [Lichenihabitans psoromatis]
MAALVGPHPARRFVMSVALAALTSGVLASAALADDPYYLSPGDRVGITVFDQPDLSGTYVVEPNGEIELPLLGPLNVTTLTSRELQAQLVARFSDGYLQHPVINVRLSELRPLTIVGEVRGAGRYAFIDGMTVETAMALAGGSLRITGEETAQRIELLRTDERLRALILTDLSQRVRKARLEAQVKNATTFTVQNNDPQNDETIKRLSAGEQGIFDAEVKSQASQVALLTQQMHSIEVDIQSFEQQVTLEKEQVDIIDHQVADVSGLLVNGLTRRSPVQDLQRERSRTQSSLSRVTGDLARAKSTLAEANLKLQDIGNAYRNRLAADLVNVQLTIDTTESALPLVREDLRLRKERLPFALKDDDNKALVLRVSRYRKGVMETFDADPSTPVRPGDILQVGTGSGGVMALPGRLSEPSAAAQDAAPPTFGRSSSADNPARTAMGNDLLSQR